MKLLCIGHSACRTGAPASLFRLIGWLKGNTAHEVKAVLGDERELYASYEALVPTRLSPFCQRQSKAQGLWAKAIAQLWNLPQWRQLRVGRFRKWLQHEKFDIVLSNTVINVREVQIAKSVGLPVVCRVAELESAIALLLGTEGFKESIPSYDRYVAVSDAVRDNLRDRHGIPDTHIDVIHGVVDEDVLARSNHGQGRLEFCRRHQINPDCLIVGGCGRPDWRKGSDLFIQLARMIKAQAKDIVFVWAGGNEGSADLYQSRYDIRAGGLENSCHYIGPLDDVSPFYNSLDVLFMSSREDPFPLVVLEAAAAGVPTLCFKDAGGAPDFVRDDAGACVSFMDLEEAAAVLTEWSQSKERPCELGRVARKRVTEDYTTSNAGPKFVNTLTTVLKIKQAGSDL